MKSLEMFRSSIAILLLAAIAPAQNTILALAFNGTALHINATTGAMTQLGPSGAPGAGCLAVSPVTGIYYTLASPQGFTLYTVDPSTGVATSTGINLTINGSPLSLYYGYASAFAVAPSGEGYVVAEGTGLYSVNLSTGVSTPVPVGFPYLSNYPPYGLAADASGMLYGWAPGSVTAGTLVTIDPVTATLTPIGTGLGDIQSLAFSPSGVLYGARGQLYTIDTATGATTAIGPGGYGDVRGIEFVPDPPQPATLSFLPGSGVVAPGGILAVLYHAPGHGGEAFAPVASCTLGTFSAPFLPQPLGVAWDFCTDFYFNDPAAHSVLPLTGAPGSFTGTLNAAGNATGFVLPPASWPSGLNVPVYITFVTWTPANSFTVGLVGMALLY